MKYAGDFELWSRFFQHTKLYGVDVPISCFRRHENQKTSTDGQKYLDEAKEVFMLAGGKVPPALIQKARSALLSACGTSLGWRRRMHRIGMLKDVCNITYDCEQSCWVKESF